MLTQINTIDLELSAKMDVIGLVRLTTGTENAVEYLQAQKTEHLFGVAQHTMLISINIKTGWLILFRYALKYVESAAYETKYLHHLVPKAKIDHTIEK